MYKKGKKIRNFHLYSQIVMHINVFALFRKHKKIHPAIDKYKMISQEGSQQIKNWVVYCGGLDSGFNNGRVQEYASTGRFTYKYIITESSIDKRRTLSKEKSNAEQTYYSSRTNKSLKMKELISWFLFLFRVIRLFQFL